MSCLNYLKEAHYLKELEQTGKTDVVAKYACIWCPHCAAQINMDDAIEMRKNPIWVREFPDAPNNVIKSYWGSGYSAGFQSWKSVLAEYFTALQYWANTGDESKLTHHIQC